jgi:predicted ATPase with chaperone activity
LDLFDSVIDSSTRESVRRRIQKHRQPISRFLFDRIDLRVEVTAVEFEILSSNEAAKYQTAFVANG